MKISDAATIASDHEFVARLTAIRHDIHRHPETAFEEVRTSDLVAAFLKERGIEVHRGLARTGVVGVLKGRRPGNRRIALRADMDALHIDEKTGKPHASTVPGKMHACGHDGHTAMMLGAAEKLAADPDFAGTVQFIFQPAEEGLGGARVMIEEGLFDLHPADAVYGLHNMPGKPLGDFNTRSGAMMSAGDTWELTLRGTGGHGAMPHFGTDPTMALATFLSGLSTIVARNVESFDSAVISVGHISAGDANSPNIIPAEVRLRGTARTFQPATRDLVERRLAEMAHAAAEMHGCTAEPNFIRRYPPVVNWPAETARAIEAARATVAPDKVNGDAERVGASEDFAFMLEKVPGCFSTVGNGTDSALVHTPLYDFNDAVIPYGVAYWLNVVQQELDHDAE
ncbi:M20 family metallopeptidase [Salipiger sp. H15]|uniref:M20 family metallopeptidase n=1 Tax=Alloyangia sp. H15 TaxID=3029062 RepID=A0AAU8ALJ9_9RHOB